METDNDVETDNDSLDSGIDINYESNRVSIDSETYGLWEFDAKGRRYHWNKLNYIYPLPSDEEESDRLEKWHFVVREIFGKNILAPINPKGARILDLGTGSGVWCNDVANEFPFIAEVIGIDISPVQPNNVFSEMEFIVMKFPEDLKDEFDTGSLDLVHSRAITLGLTEDQWPQYLSEIFRILKPGGWVQCGECRIDPICSDGSVPDNAKIFEYYKYINTIFTRMNLIISGDHLPQSLADAGFEDITVIKKNIDIGDWRGGHPNSRDGLTLDPTTAAAGKAARKVWSDVCDPMAKYIEEWVTEEQERKKFVDHVLTDLENPNYHLYSEMYMVLGRKPRDLDQRKSEHDKWTSLKRQLS